MHFEERGKVKSVRQTFPDSLKSPALTFLQEKGALATVIAAITPLRVLRWHYHSLPTPSGSVCVCLRQKRERDFHKGTESCGHAQMIPISS